MEAGTALLAGLLGAMLVNTVLYWFGQLMRQGGPLPREAHTPQEQRLIERLARIEEQRDEWREKYFRALGGQAQPDTRDERIASASARFRELLAARLSLEEIRTAAYDLNLFDELPPDGSQSAQLRTLLEALRHRDRNSDMLAWLAKHREDVFAEALKLRL